MTDNEKAVAAFCKDYLDWVERGAPEENPFTRTAGLCGNFNYCWRNCVYYGVFNDILRLEFGEDITPFGGTEHYSKDYKNSSMHLNDMRIEWVRKWAAKHVD